MKRNAFRTKVLSILLVLTMVLPMTSCGKAKTDEDENRRYYRSDYINDLPDSIKSTNGMNGIFCGNKIFYTHLNQEDYTSSIYSYDVQTKEEVCYWDAATNPMDYTDPFAETLSSYCFAPTVDGGVYIFFDSNRLDESQVDMAQYENVTEDDIIDYMATNWYGSREAAEEGLKSIKEEYEKRGQEINYAALLIQMVEDYSKRIDTYYIQEYKADGSKGKRIDLDIKSAGYLYPSYMRVDAKGYVYTYMEESSDTSYETYILVVDPQGNVKGKIAMTDQIMELVSLQDGSVGYVGTSTGDPGFSLYTLDGENLKAVEGTYIGQSQPNKIFQKDAKTIYYTLNQGLYILDTDTMTSEFVLNWMDVNISSGSVGGFSVFDDGKIGVYTDTYTGMGEAYDVAILSEISAEEAKNVKTINLVCFTMDSSVESAVIEFNKRHTDYHISATQYYDYNSSTMDYDTAKASFVTSIANRKDIDIVAFDSYSQMIQFAAKGLLTDLTPIMEGDDTISRDKILPNIVKACSVDDKLVALPTSFSVNTLLGKQSDVGTKATWTVDDVLKLMRVKDPTTQIVQYVDRATALQNMVSLNYSNYVNMADGTCNFDTKEFQDVLRFCEYFPKTSEYVDDGETSEEKMQKGTLLLAQFSLPNFMEQQSFEAIYGEKVNFVGYPTEGQSGGMMSFGAVVGITSNCKHTDLAWDYMRNLFQPQEEMYGDMLNYNGSILKADFDTYFDSQVDSTDYEGISYWFGNYSVNMHAPSQEEVDSQKNAILNITAVSDSVPSNVLNIIQEEAEAYYSGQKTVEDVCKIIQSRLTIYLSETD